MAGAGTTFFTAKRDAAQVAVKVAATATQHEGIANQALGILSKPSLTSAEAELLIEYYQQLSGSGSE